jgi:hypothetical protein
MDPRYQHLPTLDDGHKMSTVYVSEDEVECAFLDLDVNKGLSLDGIAPVILKWKESFVVPLFNSGDKRDVSCYHGISIILAIVKLLKTIEN